VTASGDEISALVVERAPHDAAGVHAIVDILSAARAQPTIRASVATTPMTDGSRVSLARGPDPAICRGPDAKLCRGANTALWHGPAPGLATQRTSAV
jgi:hypothetical protein